MDLAQVRQEFEVEHLWRFERDEDHVVAAELRKEVVVSGLRLVSRDQKLIDGGSDFDPGDLGHARTNGEEDGENHAPGVAVREMTEFF